jgi:FAD binding domain
MARSATVIEETNLPFFSEPNCIGSYLRRINGLFDKTQVKEYSGQTAELEIQISHEEQGLDALVTKLQLSENVAFINRRKLNKIVEISVPNQVVTVQAGCTIGDLNVELSKYGLCLPYSGALPTQYQEVQIGVALEWDYPNFRVATFGSWRDWLLEAHIVLANGSAVKSGSKVVKSVSGYDLHKLMVGSRGTLGIVHEVTLRVTPLVSLNTEYIECIGDTSGCCLYQRVKPSDFEELKAYLDNVAPGYVVDRNGSQIYGDLKFEDVQRFKDDFVFHRDEGFMTEPSQGEIGLMRMAKSVFDPTDKLNPGEFKFL